MLVDIAREITSINLKGQRTSNWC